MSAPIFSLGLLVAFLGCGGGEKVEVPTGKNIVLVSVDTLRSDRLPAYGYDGVDTPALDALRADGILFERAYSPVPLTLPAHASLLTGLLPPDHGLRDNAGYRLDHEAGLTVAELLSEQDYATVGFVSSFVLREETGIARGFGAWDDELEAGAEDTISQIQRPGAETSERAVEWLRLNHTEVPWLLFFHIYEPHTPYEPGEPFASRYPSAYDGEIALSDQIVGDLLGCLRELDLYEDATVIFLSDHGEGLGDHGEEEHGVLLYRESIQVPLIVKLPGALRAGETVTAPVQLTDVAATLLDLGGAIVPENVAGTSLVDFLVSGASVPESRTLYSETFHPRLRFGWSDLTSVIRGRFHYIRGADHELYDLVADPDEDRNLVREERRIYSELRRSLATFEPKLELPFAEDSQAREALASLGYLGGGAPAGNGSEIDPKEHLDDLAVLRRGVDRLQAGKTRDALPLLRRSSEAIPRSIDAWQFLGLALQRSGRNEEALKAYERAFELSSGSPLLAEPLARLSLSLGRVEDGLAYLRLAIEEDPDDLGLRLTEVGVLLVEERVDEALGKARRIVAKAPSNPDGLYLMGAVRMAMGDLEEAESEFREALAEAPGHPGAIHDLAVLLASQGRREEARNLLRSQVKARPEDQRARRLLERLAE